MKNLKEKLTNVQNKVVDSFWLFALEVLVLLALFMGFVIVMTMIPAYIALPVLSIGFSLFISYMFHKNK